MQLFEILLLSSSITYLVLNLFFQIKIKKTYISAVLIFVILLHFLFEGYRWQMLFCYLIWLIALITGIKQSQRKSKTIIKFFKGFGLAILFVFGVFFPSVLPVFDLPQPKGPYSVGTTDILLELDREEIITENKYDKRKLMIKVWYPTNDKVGEMDLYVDDGGRHGFAQKYGLPNSTFNYLDKVNTHVFRNASVADKKFPVLVFSHGYNSKANNYYALLSQIVSEGYVVFAVNHTYESTGTTFPDGSEVYFNYEYAQKIESGTWKNMEPVIEAFKGNLSFEERHPIVKKGLKTYFVRKMVERWAKDITDVIDNIDSWNTSGFFKGKLDVENIGVFGHSRGGGAAGEAFLSDNRIKAGVNIDGVQWGRIVDTSFQNPFLFISADWPKEKEDLNSHAYINKSQSAFYEARILNTGHSSFMDIPFMIHFKSLSQAGDIKPELGIEITSKLVTSFFDSYLKKKTIDFNLLNSEYDQLNLKIYRGKLVKENLSNSM
ncbi:hypothetical protein [Yeosuana marina]|uniref:alpha/beta hydrolase family protein n=1 Tax=Yeosuana marina TaxID=1565536 RepID=UPI0030EBB4F5|tara:strand:+ start:296 stop:1768 length:1473 start_codon:yes stop_codon:yes gene_type:complete